MAVITVKKFIALEGINGVGKTTQAERLYDNLSGRFPRQVVHALRDPGSTRLGEDLRQLLTRHRQAADPVAELLLHAAARRQAAAECVAPWLRQGDFVIADRYSQSSMAYQYVDIRRRMDRIGRRVAARTVSDIDDYATQGIRPGLNILLDPDDDDLPAIIARRHSGGRPDADFLQEVSERYRELADESPHEWCVLTVRAGQSVDEVAAQALNAVLARLELPA